MFCRKAATLKVQSQCTPSVLGVSQIVLKGPPHPLEKFCIQVHFFYNPLRIMEFKHTFDLKMTEKNGKMY